MISRFSTSNVFSLATIQALKIWSDESLIDEIIPPLPPSSGFIENSLETVYGDMVLDNDGYPSGKPSSWGQFYHGTVGALNTYLYLKENLLSPYQNLVDPDTCTNPELDPSPSHCDRYPEGYFEWTLSNLWWESDMQLLSPNGCTTAETTATNSCLEVSIGRLHLLSNMGFPNDQSKWEWEYNGDSGSAFTGGPVNHSGRGCDPDTDFVSLRNTMPADFNLSSGEDNVGVDKINVRRLPNGNIQVNPINGYRYHAWGSDLLAPTDGGTVECIYGCYWFKISLIDPNGVDDRDLYNQIVHVASDIRNDAHLFPACCPTWSVGSLSRYKKVPNNGDWIPVNFISFRSNSAYNNEPHQTTLQRIIDVNPPIELAPNS